MTPKTSIPAGGPLPGDDRADGPESPENGEQNGTAEASVSPETGQQTSALEPSDPGGEAERRARLAEDRLGEVLSAYRKVKTENEGFRDRITRNVERRFDQRRERLLGKFIEILDNLDRALEAAEQSSAGGPLIEGLILVRTQLLQTLQEEGLERIPVLGLPFDPNFSEAVGKAPVADAEHDHVVVKELLRGYRLNGRIARASRVMIGEYGGPDTGAYPRVRDGALIGADEVEATARAETGKQAAAAKQAPSREDAVGKTEKADIDLAEEARKALHPLYTDEPDD
jgi:molecular chaperone GrpE